MKKRTWVLVLALIITLLITGMYASWRITRANDIIKRMLLARARTVLAQETDIVRVDLDLRSLHLKGVRIVPKDRSFTMTVEDVRLGFTVWNLIKHRFRPHKIPHEIVMVRPRIFLPRQIVRMNGINGIAGDSGVGLREYVEELDAMRRITVAGAEVYVADSLQNVRIAHDVHGWLYAIPMDSAVVRLDGKLFGAQSDNMKLDGSLDLITGRPLRLAARIEESEPIQELPFLLPEYVEVTSGRLAGEVVFDHGTGTSGSLEIRDGSLSFKNARLNLEGVDVRGDLRGRTLEIDGIVRRLNGSSIHIGGHIENLLDPGLAVVFTASRFDVPRFLDEVLAYARLPVDGRAEMRVVLTGTMKEPRMEGRFRSAEFTAYGVRLDRMDAAVGFADDVLTLKGRGEQEGGLVIDVQGRMDVADPGIPSEFDMRFAGDAKSMLPAWMQPGVRSAEGTGHARVEGVLDDLEGTASAEIAVAFSNGENLRLMPAILYRDRNLNVGIASNTPFRMDGDVLSAFQETPTWEVRVEGLSSLLGPFVSEELRRRIVGLDVSVSSVGTEETWNARIAGLDAGRTEFPEVFEIRLGPPTPSRVFRAFSVQARYFGPSGEPLPLFLDASVEEEGVRVRRGRIGSFAELGGFVSYGGGMEGRLSLSGMVVEDLHGVFPWTAAYEGTLSGNLGFRGDPIRFDLDSGIRLTGGRFHGVGLFDGRLGIRVTGGELQECSVDLRRDGSALLSGSMVGREGGALGGGLSGRDLDMGALIAALTGERILEGRGEIDIAASGRTDDPVLEARVRIGPGRLGNMAFDELSAEVADTLLADGRFAGGMLYVRKGRIQSAQDLKVLFWGEVPHDSEEDIDISVLAEGNLLGILPEAFAGVRRASGEGEAFTRWAGRPGEWVLGSGRLKLEDGELELGPALGRVKSLTADVEIVEEDRFFRISGISGELGGGTFILSNRMASGDEAAAPLVFEGLGVDAGVLLLRTGEKGIRVHLPGLMERREKGWIRFLGYEGEGPFHVSGPVENPRLRGMLRLRDVRFTYPFLKERRANGSAGSLDFVEKIHWDLRIVPDKDVHYIRNIVSPLGNVYIDLKVRDDLGEFYVAGIPDEGPMLTWGNLVSTEGNLDVLDHYFRPERITFDYPRGAKDPILAGRAFTTIIDSTGLSSTVWLTVSATDDDTGLETEAGPWSKVQFRFSTDNPNLARTEADLLAALGYSMDKLSDRAYDVLGMRVENVLFRPIFKPIERGLRTYLGLDMVRFYSMFSRNLVQIQTRGEMGFDPRLLLRSTKLMVGKYLAPGVLIVYSGQVQNGPELQYLTHGLGFKHALTLEYAIRPDLFLQAEYTYDSQLLSDRREDKRIWVRHVFPF